MIRSYYCIKKLGKDGKGGSGILLAKNPRAIAFCKILLGQSF